MNAPAPTFDAEQARLAAAAHLQPAHFVEFQRLAKSLIHGPQFQLLIVDCRDERLRAKVLESLALIQQQAGLRGAEFVLDDSVGDVQVLESRLVALAVGHEVIHVMGASHWMDAGRWESFNLLRERFAVLVRVRLVFWLNSQSIKLVARHASDIWAWRAGVYLFESALPYGGVASAAAFSSSIFDFDDASGDMGRRSELESILINNPELSEELLLPLLKELGDVCYSLGDFRRALEVRESLADLLRRSMGEEHPDTLIAIIGLAEVFSAENDFYAAQQILEKALDSCQHRLGPEHPISLRVVSDLAVIFLAQNKYPEALRLQWMVVEAKKRILGDGHPDTLSMLSNYANLLRLSGDVSGAALLEREVLEKRQDIFGESHPYTLAAMGNLAATLKELGELSSATKIQKRALDVACQAFGREGSLTTVAAFNYFITLLQINDDEANSVFKEYLEWMLFKSESYLNGVQHGILKELKKVQGL